MINIDIENKKIVMDDEFQARNTKYYSDMLDEFEMRKIDEKKNCIDDRRLDNIIKILEGKLNISNDSEICIKLRDLSKQKFGNSIDRFNIDFSDFIDDIEPCSDD
ncbi:hypothetical protein FG379_001416 [Cryptosporidium bovis]|uniref:uncharacterized protein n=1 Tax=Cryptosporidium bovis TaxID=310047 RepID=UPI00351A6806|nr:hypothetical protein FG379_001416 [Cryptosporidium bovis]